MGADTLDPPGVPISSFFARLFGLRWALGWVGSDPCDEWNADTILGLPEGLTFKDGEVQYQCRVCEQWTQWPVEIEDFELDHPHNVCGGSPRCCP